MASGSPLQQRYATRIYPIRRRGNLLLTTLLLGNVAVNSLLSILLADLTSGAVGFLVSTGVIVVFGEICPQAGCSRHALAVGYYTVPIVYGFMLVLFPLAYPISIALDYVLGDELGTIYSKTELSSLISHHALSEGGTLAPDEAAVLQSALSFSTKTVAQCMTQLTEVFYVEADDLLDRRLLEKVTKTGFSRVPVRNGPEGRFVGVLHVKDLAHLDPDDATPVRAIIARFPRNLARVIDTTSLDKMLPLFREKHSHMAIVYKVDSASLGADPVPMDIGLITLEDVIEELIGQDIVDETDVDALGGGGGPNQSRDSDVYARELAAIDTFLATTRPNVFGILDPEARSNLLRRSRVLGIDKGFRLYSRGKRCHKCTLVLSGRVDVTSGADMFPSIAGPFTLLGVGALGSDSFIPSFSAVADEPSRVLQISNVYYKQAVAGTLEPCMEREVHRDYMTRSIDESGPPVQPDDSIDEEQALDATDESDTSRGSRVESSRGPTRQGRKQQRPRKRRVK